MNGVLVLRAPEEVQRLVQELLRALAQNSTEAREANATRELVQMQTKIESLTQQLDEERARQARLERRSEEAEAAARKYQNELRLLLDSQQD